jgi:hypothetical protein
MGLQVCPLALGGITLEAGFLPLDFRFKGKFVQREDQVRLLDVLSFLEEDAGEFSCDLPLHGDGGVSCGSSPPHCLAAVAD